MIEEDFLSIREQIQQQVMAHKEKIESLSKIHFDLPQPNDILLKTTAPFSGVIYPPKEFTINGLKVLPEASGEFSLILPVTIGKNEFRHQCFREKPVR